MAEKQSSQIKSDFYDRVVLATSQGRSLEYMADWMCKNTAHPNRPNRNWSFEDHEFQIDIVRSTSPKQTVKKCSQVGLSEISARKALALITLKTGIHLIYTLPTSRFARVFSQTRISPIISSSRQMKSLLDKETDSTTLKKIGDSFIYFVGTYSKSSPISIPATYIVSDEVDFSDQGVLTEFNSRTGHQKVNELSNIKFSTPTIEGYGISDEFDRSSQGRYAVKCEHCEKWQAPKFMHDVVLPRSNLDVREITRHDVAAMTKEDLDSAYLACPNCRRSLTNSLLNKERRQWIHKYPSRQLEHEGFHVVPFDVPTVNPVGRTLSQILDYQMMASFYNFKLGETYNDDTAKFSIDAIKNNTQIMDSHNVSGAVIGVDVGKISWVSVGVPYINYTTKDVEQLNIVDLIKIDASSLPNDDILADEIIKIGNKYKALVIVVDGAPDFTTANKVHKKYCTNGVAYGNYYTNDSVFAKEMTYYKVTEAKGMVTCARTMSLDFLSELNNSGNIKYPKGNPNMDELQVHFDSLKRSQPPQGEQANWVKREKAHDHWVHSINYLNLAAHISAQSGKIRLVSLSSDIKTVGMKGIKGYEL